MAHITAHSSVITRIVYFVIYVSVPVQCGTHNGTFLCDNQKCIYETWTCDKTNDCGDNSDEQGCDSKYCKTTFICEDFCVNLRDH